jgi:competence protein ComEA
MAAGLPSVAPVRGESGRVATRVRELLGTDDGATETGRHGGDAGDDPLPARSRRAALRLRFRLDPGRWRLDPGRRAAIVIGLGVLVAAVATGAWVLADRPRPVAVSATSAGPVPAVAAATGSAADPVSPRSRAYPGPGSSTSSRDASAHDGSASSGGEVVVDVAGKVRRPGLYRLAAGARVDDAVRSAGGALHGVNLASLNLAARVVDGQQIRVGLPGTAPSDAAPEATEATGATTAAGGPVDLNTATSQELQTLPGVGPVLAQHILDWRAAHGRFETVGRLNDVPGIGEVKFAALRSRVTV